jgi:hypothetical protein
MQACPVNFIKVDETAIRINGWLNLLLIAAYFYLDTLPIIAVMGVDYLLKQACPKNSPLGLIAKGIASVLKLKPKPVDSAPKRFAAFLGFVMLLAVLAFYQSGHLFTAQGVLLVFGICTFLEAVFGFCAGCLIYRYLPTCFKGVRR